MTSASTTNKKQQIIRVAVPPYDLKTASYLLNLNGYFYCGQEHGLHLFIKLDNGVFDDPLDTDEDFLY